MDLESTVGDLTMESITLKTVDGQSSGSTFERAGLFSQSTSSCSSTPLEDIVCTKSTNLQF